MRKPTTLRSATTSSNALGAARTGSSSIRNKLNDAQQHAAKRTAAAATSNTTTNTSSSTTNSSAVSSAKESHPSAVQQQVGGNTGNSGKQQRQTSQQQQRALFEQSVNKAVSVLAAKTGDAASTASTCVVLHAGDKVEAKEWGVELSAAAALVKSLPPLLDSAGDNDSASSPPPPSRTTSPQPGTRGNSKQQQQLMVLAELARLFGSENNDTATFPAAINKPLQNEQKPATSNSKGGKSVATTTAAAHATWTLESAQEQDDEDNAVAEELNITATHLPLSSSSAPRSSATSAGCDLALSLVAGNINNGADEDIREIRLTSLRTADGKTKIDLPVVEKPKSKKQLAEEAANPWRKNAAATASASAAAAVPFQLQSKGWSSAQACGRTANLSVTCLVLKQNQQNLPSGAELRHVDGAVTSISANSDNVASTTLLSLTSTAAPVQITWTTTAATTNNSNSGSGDSNSIVDLEQFPVLVPSGPDCNISVGAAASSSSLLRTVTYEGPMLNGARHGNTPGLMTVTTKTTTTRAALAAASSTAAKPLRSKDNLNNASDSTSDAEGNDAGTKQHIDEPKELRAFSRIQFHGHWHRDSFSGPGTVAVDWEADMSGAGSGCLSLVSSEWTGLGAVADTADVTVRFGGNPETATATPSTRDSTALVFGGAQSTGMQAPSSRSPYMSFVCVGKMLSQQQQQQQSTKKDEPQKQDSNSSNTSNNNLCYHTFKCTAAPILRILPKDGIDLAARNSTTTGNIANNSADLGFNRARMNNNINDETGGVTLGAFLGSRSATPTSSSNGNGSSSNNVAAIPRLLASLASAEVLQLLFARSKVSTNSVEVAQHIEGILASRACRWALLLAASNIVKDKFIEPRRFELAKLKGQLEGAQQKRAAATKAHNAAKEEFAGMSQEVELMKKLENKTPTTNETGAAQKQQQHDDKNSDAKQEHEEAEEDEQLAQLAVETASAKVDLEEQRQLKSKLEAEVKQAQQRIKAVDDDVDALQRERDHCSDSRRSLAAKKQELDAARRKKDAAFDAARSKFDDLRKQRSALELQYFVEVMEPEERAKIVAAFVRQGGESSTTTEHEERERISKQIQSATSQLDAQRKTALEAAANSKSSTTAMEEQKEKLRQQIKETPDESTLLVAFQSAEAQSEIVLSRIRALQSGGGGVDFDSSSSSSSALYEGGEAGIRSRHAATMANFAKRVADVRDSIRVLTDKEAALVQEVDELQKKLQQSSATATRTTQNSNSNASKGKSAAAAASTASTAPVQDEYFHEENDPRRKKLASLRTELKTTTTELRELKLAMRGPSLLLLDSAMLAGCSNELLRNLLNEAKNISNNGTSSNSSNVVTTPIKQSLNNSSSMNAASSPAIFSPTQQQTQWDLSTSMRDFDSKSRALSQALQQCDREIADLRSKSHRMRQLEAKLEVALEAASVAQTSSQISTRMQQQQQQHARSQAATLSLARSSSSNGSFNNSSSSSAAAAAQYGRVSASSAPPPMMMPPHQLPSLERR